MSNKAYAAAKKGGQYKRSCIRVQTADHGESMTRQSHAAECDINNIMRRYQKDGVVTHFNKFGEQYGDVTGLDFTTAMQTIAKGQQMFDELPSSARSRFANDPAQFLEFVNDPNNHPEMVELGLAKGLHENPAPSVMQSPASPSTVNNPSAVEPAQGEPASAGEGQ